MSYCVRGTRPQPLICVGCSVHYWVSCAINKGRFFEITFSSSTHICLALRRLLTWWFLCPGLSSFKGLLRSDILSSESVHRSVFAESSKAFIFQKFAVKFYFGLSLHIFQHGSSLSLENVCDSWCMHQTGFSSAAVVPQSKFTELCSSAAVVPQSKSTEMWSSAAPFDHDLWYFRYRTNEHFNSMLFIRKNL